MAWTPIPGVRQDARGRLYRVLLNSRGRQDIQYVQGVDGLEEARMIPVPEPKIAKRATLTVKKQEQKQRVAVVEWRDWDKEAVFRDFGPVHVIQAFVDEQLRPLMRSPDQGKTWIAVEQPIANYFNQWHQEAE